MPLHASNIITNRKVNRLEVKDAEHAMFLSWSAQFLASSELLGIRRHCKGFLGIIKNCKGFLGILAKYQELIGITRS